VTWYTVNGSVTFAAWVTVDAESPGDALDQARSLAADDFDYDTGTGEIAFDVSPAVEVAS
jgi:hypothetical protein